ncbi:hypothetical protein [Deinococcus radiotolerans]|uniref:Uncharacterized protein n=1 Tax=Deinococcus radiotolerans TaxID=1309407 RepID=A0ABQ2FHX5_9DEIO|nr:hypothetical protein [Deinococcus radiotolerans]GGK90948.1 hypothetical protein GCM10010844_06870 [Deinococcus radiotolerans]
MDQLGRLTAREYHGRLKEALERYRLERARTLALVEEAHDALSKLQEIEEYKAMNMGDSGGGLAATPKGEAIQYAADVLGEIVGDLWNLFNELDVEEDPAQIDLDGLYSISKP